MAWLSLFVGIAGRAVAPLLTCAFVALCACARLPLQLPLGRIPKLRAARLSGNVLPATPTAANTERAGERTGPGELSANAQG